MPSFSFVFWVSRGAKRFLNVRFGFCDSDVVVFDSNIFVRSTSFLFFETTSINSSSIIKSSCSMSCDVVSICSLIFICGITSFKVFLVCILFLALVFTLLCMILGFAVSWTHFLLLGFRLIIITESFHEGVAIVFLVC